MSASGGRGGRFKSPKLEELSEKLFGHKFDEAHNAAADVNATAQAFFEMMRLEVYPLDKIFFDDVQMKAFKEHNPDVFKPFNIVIRRQVADSKSGKKLLILAILMILILGISSIFIATVFILPYRQRPVWLTWFP